MHQKYSLLALLGFVISVIILVLFQAQEKVELARGDLECVVCHDVPEVSFSMFIFASFWFQSAQ
jgi:hypothetical protein